MCDERDCGRAVSCALVAAQVREDRCSNRQTILDRALCRYNSYNANTLSSDWPVGHLLYKPRWVNSHTNNAISLLRQSDMYHSSNFKRRTASASRCPSSYLECDNGRCLQVKYVCNGDIDCIDGSDEMNCSCECDMSYESSVLKSQHRSLIA